MKRDKLFTSLKVAAAIYILASIIVTAGCGKKDDNNGGVVGPNGWFGNCLSAGCVGIDPNAVLLQNVQARNYSSNALPEGALNLVFNVYGTFIPPMTETPINSYSGSVVIRGQMHLNYPINGCATAGTYDIDTVDVGYVAPGTGVISSGIAQAGQPVTNGMRLIAIQQGTGARLDMRLGNGGGAFNYASYTSPLGMFVGYGPLSPASTSVRFATTNSSFLTIDVGNGIACGAAFGLL